MGYGSNRGRPSEIGRPGRFGLVGAAARLAGALLRGGGRPEKWNWGLPDSVWAPVWPWGMREACVIHWSGKRGAAGDGAGCTAWRRLGVAAHRRREVFGPCRRWVQQEKGSAHTRKMRHALRYTLQGLTRSAEGLAVARLR